MKISIIIPIYNVAKYIERCLDFVCLQTYPDLECIIVDDCSTDNSLDIIETKLAGYSGPIDFKIIRRQANGNSAATRNTGVAAATGEYLYFLDSDDLITSDAISLLAEPLKNEPLDLVIGDIADNIQAICVTRLQIPPGIIRSNHEIFASFMSYQWYVSAWNKLVRRQFLIDHGIAFAEDIKRHEDELWSFKIACMAQTMCCVKEVTYVYCSRDNSKIHMLDDSLHSLVRTTQEAEAFVKAKNLGDNIDIRRFLLRWREGLGHKAWHFKKPLAYSVYREHVWRHPAMTLIYKEFPQLKEINHWHHAMPARVGFCYYMMYKILHRKVSALSTS